MGLVASLVFSLFFNYSREALRIVTLSRDLFILPDKNFRIYDIFFAAFSISLGMGFAIIFWLGELNNPIIKRRYFRTYAVSNSWFIIFIALMVVARFGSVLPFILYGVGGYDNHLDLLHEYGFMFVLIPIVVFYNQWNSIRLIFRTRYWIVISIGVCLLITFCLLNTTGANRHKLNKYYYLQNMERFNYIDNELLKAQGLGVVFDDSINLILQKQYAERTTELVHNLKENFNHTGLIPIDSLILEKIVIHNRNYQGRWFGHQEGRDQNWSFVLHYRNMKEREGYINNMC